MTRQPLETEHTAAAARVRDVLAEARRRWFLKAWLRIATEVTLVAALALLAAWTITLSIPPTPGTLSLLALAVIAVVGTFLVRRAWLRWQAPADTRVARYVEEHVPELDEAFVSAVDCLKRDTPSSLASLVFAEAGKHLETLDLDRIVSRATIRRRMLECAGAIAALVAVVYVARGPLLDALALLRMAVFPPVITLEVASGDIQIREGSEVHLKARVLGLPARLPQELLKVALDLPGRDREVPMAAAGEWQQLVLTDARASFDYSVSGYGVSSRSYHVDVRPRPRVSQIDVHYEFPAFSGLAPRVDQDSGDVYAPAGTKVRLVVHTTVPVTGARLGLRSGSTLPFDPTPKRTVEGGLVVTKDDAYRVTLIEGDGTQTVDDTEYFVRTVDDRPPEVRIIRPAGDSRVTRLEEVVIEARADDDYGIDRLELVYAARGGVEHVVPLGKGRATTATGRHTVFVEDLDVLPGDFVSYYARARDVARGKRSTETRSDIFFLEVRPFNEEFEAAQSSSMAGMNGGAFEDLAARQKELIVATWKLERRSGAGRSSDDIKALARAQGELKAKAEQLASRLAPRGAQRRPRPLQPNTSGVAIASPDETMRRAVEAMDRSEKSLQVLQTGPAIPHEMEALNQLLKAQAEITRRQVAQQQSAGGGGGETGNQDLSALFDRELQRQQQTNYENRSSAEEEESDEKKSEALDRLRELARRQDELSKRQQELVRREAQIAAEEMKRQLEKLTREQEELRKQAERLAAQLQEQQQNQQDPQQQQQRSGRQSQSGEQGSSGQSEGAQGDSTSQAVQAAAESMGQSAGGMGREQLKEAASQSQRAAERLREAERRLAGGQQQPDESARAAGDLQLEAAQLAETERRIARQLREQPRTSADQLRQLAGEQERAAERAARLADRARSLRAERNSQSSPGAGSSASSRPEASRSPLADAQIEEQLRAAARALRENAERGTAGDQQGSQQQQQQQQQQQREAERAENVARTLEGAAREMGRAGGGGQDDRGELSEQLARAGEMRDRLAELTRRFREGGQQPGREGQQSSQGRDGQSPQNAQNGSPQAGSPSAKGNQPGAAREGQPSPKGNGNQEGGQQPGSQGTGQGEGQASSSTKGAAREASGQGSGSQSGNPSGEEVNRELRSLGRLADGLGENNYGLQQALRTLEEYSPSRSAPGTEPWKQDFSRWESLQKEIVDALEQLEVRVSNRLQTEEQGDRLDAGANDATPDAYRREVARYYRSLAKKPPS